MKLIYKLVFSFLLVTAIMGAFGLYMFQNVSNQLSDKHQEINNVTSLTSAVQSFHTENYHLQLDSWEYAYEPNEERLNAFYSHLITWEALFDDFIGKAEAADLTFEEAELITRLQSGSALVRSAWHDVVTTTASIATGNIESPTLNADGTEKYPLLDDMSEYGYYFRYPMFDMSTSDVNDPLLRSTMINLEELFNNAKFNEITDEFVSIQQDKLATKQTEMEDLKSSLTTQFIIAFVLVLVFAIALALLLTRMIVHPIKKLTEVANQVSHGNTDMAVPNIKSKDEIGDLAKSFGRMVASVKFMMTDKEE
ncbi:MAG: HAMP domain-containing protein [Dehalococcoidales bacterium]|nr:HAMP domain-containing protein [Dehalococcoidales bacterium]